MAVDEARHHHPALSVNHPARAVDIHLIGRADSGDAVAPDRQAAPLDRGSTTHRQDRRIDDGDIRPGTLHFT